MNPFAALMQPMQSRPGDSSPPRRVVLMPHKPVNPWGLTDGQCKALDVMVKTGCFMSAAAELKRSNRTLMGHLRDARIKMQLPNATLAILQWDRYTRGEQ